jgi:hypothetical protein
LDVGRERHRVFDDLPYDDVIRFGVERGHTESGTAATQEKSRNDGRRLLWVMFQGVPRTKQETLASSGETVLQLRSRV